MLRNPPLRQLAKRLSVINIQSMRELKQLNIEESITQEKLIFKESWLDKFDTIIIYLFFGWASVIPFIIYFDPHRNQNETGIFYYVPFLLTLLGIWVIYRKATEKKLIKVSSKFYEDENRELIKVYFNKEKFEKNRDSKRLIIFNEDADFNINPNYKTSYIFLFDKNYVLFTVIKERFKLNLPTLIKHLILKRDLKKLLNNKID